MSSSYCSYKSFILYHLRKSSRPSTPHLREETSVHSPPQFSSLKNGGNNIPSSPVGTRTVPQTLEQHYWCIPGFGACGVPRNLLPTQKGFPSIWEATISSWVYRHKESRVPAGLSSGLLGSAQHAHWSNTVISLLLWGPDILKETRQPRPSKHAGNTDISRLISWLISLSKFFFLGSATTLIKNQTSEVSEGVLSCYLGN